MYQRTVAQITILNCSMLDGSITVMCGRVTGSVEKVTVKKKLESFLFLKSCANID